MSPMPNNHACRLRPPEDFQPKSFRTMTDNQPKGMSIIIARPKGKTTTAAQSVRYETGIWDEDRARSDCGDRGGTFEPAAQGAEEAERFPEASYQDILGLLLDDRIEEDYTMLFTGIKEAELSYNDREIILRAAVNAKFKSGANDWVWVCDTWDKYLVYRHESGNDEKFYKVDYVMNDQGEVTLGDPKEVIRKTVYEAVTEAATIKAQVQALIRGAAVLLKTKNLPAKVTDNVKALQTHLSKTWAELSKSGDNNGDGDGDSDATPAPAAAAAEADNMIEIGNEFIALIEATKGSEIVHIKVIEPGWGSSGYYSPEVLEAAAPQYAAGTKMFWDHPTRSDESERPERSLRDLAGVLVSAGTWESGGSAGPGIYADAKVFGGYKEVLSEIGNHIGVSHRAMGRAKAGEAEGRKGPIIENIAAVQSVDFVTSPGAGGRVLQLFEAAKGVTITPSNIERKEDEPMTETERKDWEAKLKEAKDATVAEKARADSAETERDRLREGEILRAARDYVTGKLTESPLPDLTKKRLITALSANPPAADGKLDEAALQTQLEEAIKSETEYLSQITGSGRIVGMGTVVVPGAVNAQESEAGKAALKESFRKGYILDGKSVEEAERLATIAAAGR